MLRRIATGARATLLTATDFTIADGLFGFWCIEDFPLESAPLERRRE
jgi:hypothetical protein